MADAALSRPELRSPLAPLLWLLAAACIGRALKLYDGTHPDPSALRWLSAALLLGGLGTWGRLTLATPRLVQWTQLASIGLILFQISALLTIPLGKRWPLDREQMGVFHGLLLVAAAAAGASLGAAREAATEFASRRPWHMAAVLGSALLAGLWFLRHDLQPHIDVFEFQQQACATVTQGNNPYAMSFANIYPDDTPFYAKELVVGGRLQFGFIYPPLVLALDWPAWALTGDHRYALWLALIGACLLAWLARPGAGALLAVTLLWTTPRTFFLTEQGWTEPFVLLGLAAVLWAARRRPSWLPWTLGLLLCTKQYMVLVLPLTLLLVRGPWRWPQLRGLLGPALLVVALVHAPFIALNPHAFWRSVVTLQMVQPFRPDSLSWLAATAQQGVPSWPQWLAFVLAAAAIAAGLWRAPRTAAGFAAATGMVFLAFLMLNKQAFWNYYHLPLGAFALGAAVSGWDGAPDAEGGP